MAEYIKFVFLCPQIVKSKYSEKKEDAVLRAEYDYHVMFIISPSQIALSIRVFFHANNIIASSLKRDTRFSNCERRPLLNL